MRTEQLENSICYIFIFSFFDVFIALPAQEIEIRSRKKKYCSGILVLLAWALALRNGVTIRGITLYGCAQIVSSASLHRFKGFVHSQ